MMVHALEWFLFGMFVWGCCIVLQAFQRRVAPEGPGHRRKDRRGRHAKRAWRDACGTGGGGSESTDREAELQAEVDRLRKRVETLEAIVTDRKFQWDQEFNS